MLKVTHFLDFGGGDKNAEVNVNIFQMPTCLFVFIVVLKHVICMSTYFLFHKNQNVALWSLEIYFHVGLNNSIIPYQKLWDL
jgi:hypothetical protein